MTGEALSELSCAIAELRMAILDFRAALGDSTSPDASQPYFLDELR